MADVPEVPVAAVAVACVERKINAVLFAVCDLIFPGLHGPQIGHSPGSNDLDIRSQSADAELKTDLVISFTGCAVADGDSAFFSGDLYQTFGNGRTGHSGSQQIFIFIDCVRLYAGQNVVVAEIIYDIFNI